MNKLLEVKDLMNILKISRSKAYLLLNDSSFPTIQFGKSKRVFEEDLLSWLQNHKKVL